MAKEQNNKTADMNDCDDLLSIRKLMDNCFSKIDPEWQKAVYLHGVYDQSYRDIAKSIGVSHDTIFKWIKKATSALIECFARYGVTEVGDLI